MTHWLLLDSRKAKVLYKSEPAKMTQEEFESLPTIRTPQEEMKQQVGARWKTKDFGQERWWLGEGTRATQYGLNIDYTPILVFCPFHEESFSGPCPKCATGEW